MNILIYGTETFDEDMQFIGYKRWAANRARVFSSLPDTTLTLLDNQREIPRHHFDLGIFVVSPFSVLRNRAYFNALRAHCTRALIEILWETTVLPEAWKEALGMFDGTIVGSHFCQELVRRQFSSTRVFYVPPAVVAVSTKSVEERMRESVFRVLYIGQNTVRKGIHDAVRAFTIALSETDDAELIIKTMPANASLGELPTTLAVQSIVFSNATRVTAPIYVIEQTLDNAAIHSLYEDSSLLLLPSRGEGLGLPYIEALLHGIPSVYVPFTASVETAGYNCNFPVEYVLDTAHSMRPHGYEPSQQYAVPLTHSLVRQLTCAYELWKKQRYAYFTRCVADRKKLLSTYSLSAAVNAARDVVLTLTAS